MNPTRHLMSRRELLGLLGLAGVSLVGLAACGESSANPAPASASASTSVAPAASSAAAAASKPAASTAASAPASAAGSADWKQQIDQWAAAAKQEGTLLAYSFEGDGYKKVFADFEKLYGVKSQLTQFSGSGVLIAKLLSEQKAGVFNADVVQAQTSDGLKSAKDAGAWDPIKPFIINPDALDNSKWTDGFDAGWYDNAKQLAYGFGNQATGQITVNSLVPDGAIKTVQDLADPKWKGKITMADVTTGFTFGPMNAVRQNFGDDMVKKLIVDQQPVFQKDARQLVDSVVRGKYAIGIGVQHQILADFKTQGLGKDCTLIDLEGMSYKTGSVVWLAHKAQHPNAAKLFLNWLLTKDGQTSWNQTITSNSRRTDVPPADQSNVPIPGRKYVEISPENAIPEVDKSRALLAKLTA